MQCGISKVVGARIGIYPMQDNFVDIILKAVKESDRTGLAVITDDLGTTVQGKQERVFSYVKEIFLRAAQAGGHVVANVLFSAGCPGDVPEDFNFDVESPAIDYPNETMRVACAWSLYPLGCKDDYFSVIAGEIEKLYASADIEVHSSHYCTRLDGSAKEIFRTLESSFSTVSKANRHTVIHATFSKGSPSKERETIDLNSGTTKVEQ